MGIRKTAGGQGAFSGQDTLRRWQEWVSVPGHTLGAPNTNWTGVAYMRYHPGAFPTQIPASVWRSLGSVLGVFRVNTEVQVLDFQPVAGAGGAREVFYYFIPWGATPYAHDFTQNFPPAVEVAADVEPAHSLEVLAWIRKKNAGDTPGARQFFGIGIQGDANFSRRIARVGLAGDGAGGFRFQSNNCPDAPAGAAENAQGDADANAVSPSILVSPGVNWFHVRVRLVTPTPTQTGRVICWLNGRQVATFAQAANIPHSSRSAVDTSQDAYWPMVALIALWGNPDGVSVDPGLFVRDLRVRLVENGDVL